MKKILAVLLTTLGLAPGTETTANDQAPPPPYRVFGMPANLTLPAGARQYIATGNIPCAREPYSTDDGLPAWGCTYRRQWIAVYPKADGIKCGRVRTKLSHFRTNCTVKFARHIGIDTKSGWLELKVRPDGHWQFVGLYP